MNKRDKIYTCALSILLWLLALYSFYRVLESDIYFLYPSIAAIIIALITGSSGDLFGTLDVFTRRIGKVKIEEENGALIAYLLIKSKLGAFFIKPTIRVSRRFLKEM